VLKDFDGMNRKLEFMLRSSERTVQIARARRVLQHLWCDDYCLRLKEEATGERIYIYHCLFVK